MTLKILLLIMFSSWRFGKGGKTDLSEDNESNIAHKWNN
jgi:hypothetical protein